MRSDDPKIANDNEKIANDLNETFSLKEKEKFTPEEINENTLKFPTKKNVDSTQVVKNQTASFSPSPAEKGKQTRALKNLDRPGIKPVEVPKPETNDIGKVAAESLKKERPSSKEELSRELPIEEIKFKQDRQRALENSAASQGLDIKDKRVQNIIKKSVDKAWKDQETKIITENAAKEREFNKAVRGFMDEPDGLENISPEEMEYNDAKQALEKGENLTPAQKFNLEKTVKDYEDEKKIQDVMAEMGTDDRNRAVSFIAQQEAEKGKIENEKARQAYRDQRNYDLRQIAETFPSGEIRNYAMDELEKMEMEDKVRESLIESGVSPDSEVFKTLEKQSMADYNRLKQIQKMEDKKQAEFKALKARNDLEVKMRILGSIARIASPWVKVLGSIIGSRGMK